MNIFYPFELLAHFLVLDVFGLALGTVPAEVLIYFLYDTLKIFTLLFVVIFIVSVFRSFLPADKIRLFLLKRNIYVGNVLASLFGIITPFCSCSAIPLFLGFVQAGVPLGVTFSFLVASPMINEVALALLLALFGWKITLWYVGLGLAIAIISGIIIGHLKVEHLLADFVLETEVAPVVREVKLSWPERFSEAKNYSWDIIKKIWLYIIVGVGLGAFIHGYVPSSLISSLVGLGHWYSVPLAVIIGIPLYSNAAGILPLVSVLLEKGVGLGTSLAFMMSVTALSLPEFLILKRVMKTRLILIFAGVVATGIMLVGFIFNFFLN